MGKLTEIEFKLQSCCLPGFRARSLVCVMAAQEQATSIRTNTGLQVQLEVTVALTEGEQSRSPTRTTLAEFRTDKKLAHCLNTYSAYLRHSKKTLDF